MSRDEMTATAETAFAIESATSPTIRAAFLVAPKEIVHDVWIMAYLCGRRDAFGDAQRWLGTTDKHVSTGPGDLDCFGRELKPGS